MAEERIEYETDRDAISNASIVSAIYNSAPRKKGSKPIKMLDLLPDRLKSRIKDHQRRYAVEADITALKHLLPGGGN